VDEDLMAVRIRLARMGAKKKPFYRVVVADSEAPRDGRFIEQIGYYDPKQDPALVHLKMERVDFWLSRGAQPSEIVAQLIKKARSSVSASGK
jgi:small subunit ribosomal protein S16